MRFAWVHSSSLSSSLWMALLPSSKSCVPLSLVSPPNLLRLHSISLSMTSIKILNSLVPNMDPEDHYLLMISIELLTATLWIWPSSQFLMHLTVHLSNLYLLNLLTRLLLEPMSKALQKSIGDVCCCSLSQQCRVSPSLALINAMMFVKHDLPFVKPCWLFLITSL